MLVIHVCRRLVRAGALAALVVLVGAVGSASASATLTIQDPAADLPRVFSYSGAGAAGTMLWVKYRPAGGPPCSTVPGNDPGTELVWNGWAVMPERKTAGAYTYAPELTWKTSGTYTFCMWESTYYSDAGVMSQQDITFRQPTGTLTLGLRGFPAVDPAIAPGASSSYLASGNLEAARTLDVTEIKGRTTCPAAASSAHGTSWSYSLPPGNYAKDLGEWTASADDVGDWTVCAWLSEDKEETTPIGHAQLNYSVAKPAPPAVATCIVPKLAGFTLGNAKKALKAAGCAFGGTVKIKKANSKVAKGRVIGTKPGAGKHIPKTTKVILQLRA